MKILRILLNKLFKLMRLELSSIIAMVGVMVTINYNHDNNYNDIKEVSLWRDG
jgi:hypothetical protein